MSRHVLLRLSIPLICVVSLVVQVSAQRRAVRGRVTDAAGAAVPGVSITLLKNSVEVRSVTTDANGVFDFDVDDLADGVFDVRISVAGTQPGRVTLRRDTPRTIVTVGQFRA